MDAATGDDAEFPVGCAGVVRGSVEALAGVTDFLAAGVDVPRVFAVDLDGAAEFLVASADSSARCRALLFTANKLS